MCAEKQVEHADMRNDWDPSYLADGVHFSPEGHKAYYKIIREFIGDVPEWRLLWDQWK